VLALAFSLFAIPATADTSEIRVILNGVELEFDVPPQIIDNRTMVPMRVIFEALGAVVYWSEEYQHIFVHTQFTNRGAPSIQELNQSFSMFLWQGSNIAGISRGIASMEEIEFDVPPQIVDNRTLVPLRAISEVFGASVEWCDRARVVTIELADETPERKLDTSYLLGVWMINDGGIMQHFAVTVYFRADGTGEFRSIVDIFIEEPPFEIHSEPFEWSAQNGQMTWGSEALGFVTYDFHLYCDILRIRFPSPEYGRDGMFRRLGRLSPDSPFKLYIPELFYGFDFANCYNNQERCAYL